MNKDVARVLDYYPRIYFACHRSHTRDPETGNVLSDHQMHILGHLDEIHPTRLTELAKHMGVTASTMSIAVDRLVRSGYVLKARDEEDARAVALRLTGNGARVKENDTVLDPGRVNEMLNMLTPAERKRGLEGLALLAKAGRELVHAKGRG